MRALPLAFALSLSALSALSACCRIGVAERPFTAAELEAERRAQLDRAGGGFDSIVVSPFVIVASGPQPRAVRDEAAEMVTWASRLLRADYFSHDPGVIITIWVFPDQDSYMRGASAVLGTIPDTPYGYFRPCSRVLVVNAGYGYGTLVHEMVHAYMAGDFPGAPTWLKEGLASLFEAPREDGGHLRGATNWRLAGLQDAIAHGRAPSFARLASAGRGTFSDRRDGPLYYATARYLCFYLQERGVLREFYRAFRSRAGEDSEGLATLRDATKLDLDVLRRDWEIFVTNLRYERPP
jgi:hypothetical protein